MNLIWDTIFILRSNKGDVRSSCLSLAALLGVIFGKGIDILGRLSSSSTRGGLGLWGKIGRWLALILLLSVRRKIVHDWSPILLVLILSHLSLHSHKVGDIIIVLLLSLRVPAEPPKISHLIFPLINNSLLILQRLNHALIVRIVRGVYPRLRSGS